MHKEFSRKGAKAQRRTFRSRWSSFAQLCVRKQALAILCLVFVSGSPALTQNKGARFDPDGSFWVLGQPPDEFLELSAINLNAKKLRRLPSPGLQVTDGKTYRFKTLTVRRNNFTFTTVTLRNVSYSFTGRFLKGGVFAENELNDETPILEGTLTRYHAGKKVAEAKIVFTYFGGT